MLIVAQTAFHPDPPAVIATRRFRVRFSGA